MAYALFGLLFWAIVFGWLGSWVADKCGRDPLEGMVLGGVFGPFGVIVEGLLPKHPRDRQREERERRRQDG